MEEPKVSPNPKSTSRKLFENAVDDAQFMVAYAAGKCKRDIDNKTLTTLITAKRQIDENQTIDAQSEAEFWLAYQYIWKLVTPSTAESIKANLPIESPFVKKLFKNVPALSRWVETTTTSKARRSVNRYIFYTVSVLIVVLLLQIYWVIGNQLTAQVAESLEKETELSLQIYENRQDYRAMEIRFMQNEMNSESFQTNGVYTFYSSPEWVFNTMENISTTSRLEADLASLKSQLQRSSDVLLLWSTPWKGLIRPNGAETSSINKNQIDQYASQARSIQRQIDEIKAQMTQDPNGSKKIQEAKNQITLLQKQLVSLDANPEANTDEILSLRSKIDSITNWVNQPQLANQIVSQQKQDIERLEEEMASVQRQQQSDIKREESRQAQLAGQFVLVILQSYLLPLLYGILGAGTSVLRSLSKVIERVTYSEEAGIQHLLRISLGALAGIMVGWFSFLIPNETTTFVGSISPLAIAFLVGYNIELFFSMMDRALHSINDRLLRPSSATEEERIVIPPNDSTIIPPKTTSSVETSVPGEAMG